MKTNMLSNLRASIFAMSAASLALVAPAFAEAGEKQKQSDQKLPEFSQLDQNRDQKLTEEELQSVAQERTMDAEQYIVLFDLDDDQALNEDEFTQLKQSESLTSAPGRMAKQGNEQAMQEQPGQRQASEQQASSQQQPGQQQASQGEGAKIVVDQKPTQVSVNKPPAQVAIDQPKPKVTITTQDPEVQVEQAEPRVSVQQPEPQVEVEQAKPEVEIQDAKPEVQVSESQPRVQVNEQEPEVAIQSAEGQQRSARQEQANTSQRSANQQQRLTNQQQSANQQQQSARQEQDLFAVAVADLREAEVVDQEGQAIGNVEEVVIKRDGSEAGFIISTTGSDSQPRHVYRAADDFSLEGDQLKLEEEGGAEALSEPQGFVAQEFRAAPNDQGTLGELTSRAGISAR